MQVRRAWTMMDVLHSILEGSREAMTTLFNYLYRDASNYKAWGALALNGEVAEERWQTALDRLEDGVFFVAEQLDVPPLYHALYKWSGGPTSADHCWHEFVGINIIAQSTLDAYRWGNAASFVTRLQEVEEWRGELSPHFALEA